MNEQLLKVSTPQSKSSFQTFEKTLFREVAPLSSPNPPVRPRVRWHHDLRKFKKQMTQHIDTHVWNWRSIN